jgi:hypothetical protein
VDGEYDHLPEQAFYMVGSIDEENQEAPKVAASLPERQHHHPLRHRQSAEAEIFTARPGWSWPPAARRWASQARR